MSLGLLLTGCAPRTVAYDVHSFSLVGDWSATYESVDLRLSLAKDGTFTVDGWPRDLICQPSNVVSVDQLEWGDSVSFGGTWRSASEDLIYALDFSFEDAECGKKAWNSYVWSEGERKLLLKIFVDSVVDADTAREDQVIWLRKLD